MNCLFLCTISHVYIVELSICKYYCPVGSGVRNPPQELSPRRLLGVNVLGNNNSSTPSLFTPSHLPGNKNLKRYYYSLQNASPYNPPLLSTPSTNPRVILPHHHITMRLQHELRRRSDQDTTSPSPWIWKHPRSSSEQTRCSERALE